MRRCRLLLALALTAVASFAHAQEPQARALVIEDYYRIKTVGAPELSPDGRWAAFTVQTRIEETNGTHSEVWLAPFDTSAPARRVSAEGTNASSPAWTSDGKLRYSAGSRTFLIDPARPGRVDTLSISSAPGGRDRAVAPLTSPDGKLVATVRDMPPPARPRTFASDFEKRHDERFRGVQFDWLEFHRDGGPFPVPNVKDPQVSPPQEVFLAAVGDDPTRARQLTHLGVRPVGLQWSKDGSLLLFSADRELPRRTRVWED